jgi:hypothetical protein
MRLKGSLTGHQKGLFGPFWPPFEEEAEPAVPEWAMAVKELFRGCA